METLIFIVIALCALIALLVVVLLVKSFSNKAADNSEQFSMLRQEINTSTQQSVKAMGEMISDNQRQAAQAQNERLTSLENRMKTFSLENEQKLDLIRKSVETKLTYIQEDNNKRLLLIVVLVADNGDVHQFAIIIRP